MANLHPLSRGGAAPAPPPGPAAPDPGAFLRAPSSTAQAAEEGARRAGGEVRRASGSPAGSGAEPRRISSPAVTLLFSPPLLLLLLLLLLASSARAASTSEILAEDPAGPLVTAADFAAALKELPPGAAASLGAAERAELLETLVGRALVDRELAAGGGGTDPVFLARLATAESMALLRHHVAELQRTLRPTAEAELSAWFAARGAALFPGRPFAEASAEAALILGDERVEAALDRAYRDFLAADPAVTGEVDLLFDRMLESPDPALAGRPLFVFRNAPPFTFLDAFGVFDLARVREGATLHAARADRGRWLERFLKTAVIRRVAEAAGVAVREGYRREREETVRNLERAWLVTHRIREAAATTAECEAFYANHPELFTSGGETRLLLIQATSEIAAREIKEALDAGRPFEELARARSVHPSAASGGDFGAVRASPDLPGYLRPALFLEPGQVSDVVVSAEGRFILKVIARTPARKTPFEHVRDRIKLLVEREKTQGARMKLFAELKNKYDVKTYPERLPAPPAR